MATKPTPQQAYDYLLKSMTVPETSDTTANVILYGDSGVGKTKEAAEIAQAITGQGREILFMDSHIGWQTMKNHPELTPRMRRLPWRNVAEMDAILDFIEEGKREPFNKIDTIIFDEYSSMAKKDLDAVIKARGGAEDRDGGTQPDFFQNTERMRKVIERVLSAELNVIILAHVRRDKDHRQIERTGPGFMPGMSKVMREMCSACIYMQADETVENDLPAYRRTFQLHPTKLVIAKCRVTAPGGKPLPVQNVPPKMFRDALAIWLKGNGAVDNTDVVHNDPAVDVVVSDEVSDTGMEL